MTAITLSIPHNTCMQSPGLRLRLVHSHATYACQLLCLMEMGLISTFYRPSARLGIWSQPKRSHEGGRASLQKKCCVKSLSLSNDFHMWARPFSPFFHTSLIPSLAASVLCTLPLRCLVLLSLAVPFLQLLSVIHKSLAQSHGIVSPVIGSLIPGFPTGGDTICDVLNLKLFSDISLTVILNLCFQVLPKISVRRQL